MRLRPKTFLLIAATFLGLLAALAVSTQVFLLGGFSDLERRETRQNVDRVLSLISEELSRLDATCGDWAFWDDTHRFMDDRNEDYVQSNLQPDSLVTLKINFMLFVDRNHRLLFSRFVDLKTEEEAQMPEGFLPAVLAADNLPFDREHLQRGRHGIIMAPGSPVLIAFRPILRSDHGGPSNGTLIVGRYLDEAAIGRFSAISRLSLDIHPADGPFADGDREAATALLKAPASVFIQPQGPDAVAGFALQPDINGQPALILKVRMPRHIYHQGLAALRYYIVFLVATALPVLTLLFFFMEKAVLRPINRLSSAVGKAGDDGGRLDAPGIAVRKDEIGGLAGAIDGFLKKIIEQKQALESANARLEDDIERRKQVEEDLAHQRDKLKEALDRVKTLSGLLPICANCKRIRNDQGYWEQIEVYVMQHSDADFSHGLCPECAKKLYGDVEEKPPK